MRRGRQSQSQSRSNIQGNNDHNPNDLQPPLDSRGDSSSRSMNYRYAAYEDEYLHGGMDDVNYRSPVDAPSPPASSNGSSVVDEEVDFDELENLPRILLMGPRRGGKTSIHRVVFHKMSPHETILGLEATQNLERSVVDHSPLFRFTVWDFPGDYYGDGSKDGDDYVYCKATALVFVIDALDEPYDHALQSFTEAVHRATSANPNVSVEVFINKVDGELFFSDEARQDCRRDIAGQIAEELHDAGLAHLLSPEGDSSSARLSFHLTSIYDHSVFEAFSRVVQKLGPPRTLPTLESLLDTLVGACSMEKAFLFDVASKLYVGTDSGPVDMQSVELCSDMIDVVLDISGIYGIDDKNDDDDKVDNDGDGGAIEKKIIEEGDDCDQEEEQEDNQSIDPSINTGISSAIRLSNGMILYLREVHSMLALVCLTRAENFKKKSLINYNIDCFKKALDMLVAKPLK